jgi:hypothetical protein
MKKILLGTTALVASAMLVTAVSAADLMPEPVEIEEGFTLTIEMDAKAGFWTGSSTECEGVGELTAAEALLLEVLIGGTTAYDAGDGAKACYDYSANKWKHAETGINLYNDFKVAFALEQTLANGLFVGAYAELTEENVKDYWGAIEGGFGAFEIGYTNNAFKSLGKPGRLGSGIMGEADGSKAAPIETKVTSDGSISGKGKSHLAYYTPSLNGISLGVSYSPDSSNSDGYGQEAKIHQNDSGNGWINILSVGANYSGEASDGWEWEFGGGYQTGEAEGTKIAIADNCVQRSGADYGNVGSEINTDLEVCNVAWGDYDLWGAGAEVGNGTITVGAGFQEIEYKTMTQNHMEASIVVALSDWNMGVSYQSETNSNLSTHEDSYSAIFVGADKEIGASFSVGVFGGWAEQKSVAQSAMGREGDDGWTTGVAFTWN